MGGDATQAIHIILIRQCYSKIADWVNFISCSTHFLLLVGDSNSWVNNIALAASMVLRYHPADCGGIF